MKRSALKNFIFTTTLVVAGVFLFSGTSAAGDIAYPAPHVSYDSIEYTVVNSLETTYIELSWASQDPEKVHGYKIYRVTAPKGFPLVDDGLIADIPLAELPFRDIDGTGGRTVAPDNTYTYKIVPYNDYGEGLNTTSMPIAFGTYYHPEQNVLCLYSSWLSSTTEPKQILLEWHMHEDPSVDRFDIKYKVDSYDTQLLMSLGPDNNKIAPGIWQYTIDDISQFGSFDKIYFYVDAVNAANDILASDFDYRGVSFSELLPLVSLGGGWIDSTNTITLKYSLGDPRDANNANLGGFRIYRKGPGEDEFSLITDPPIPPSARMYRDEDAIPYVQGTYRYKITTIALDDPSFEGPYFSERSVPVPAVLRPHNIRFTYSEDRISINWDPPQAPPDGSAIVSYEINKFADNLHQSRTDLQRIVNVDPDTTSFGLTELVPNDFLTIRLTTITGSGERSLPESAYIITGQSNEEEPIPPSGVNAYGGSNKVVFKWPSTEEFNVTGYCVYRSSEGPSSGYAPIRYVTSNLGDGQLYVDRELTNGQTYYYRFTAIKGNPAYVFTNDNKIHTKVYSESGFSQCIIGSPIEKPIVAPENVLIIVNSQYPDYDGDGISDSVSVGEYYRQARGIPQENLFTIDTPHFSTIYKSQRPELFGQIIDPLRQYLETTVDTQGVFLKDKIYYIVPTLGVPYRIYEAKHLGFGYWAYYYSMDAYLERIFDDSVINKDPLLTSGFRLTDTTKKFIEPGEHFDNAGNLYLVSRLDGPTLEIAKGLVDKALYAEEYLDIQSGGTGYFDAWGYYNDQGIMDGFIYAADSVEAKGISVTRIEDIYPDAPDTIGYSNRNFKPGDCPDALYYYGWYKAWSYEPTYDWVVGAVGHHLHSFGGRNIRSGDRWVPMMLHEGITGTMGYVDEPLISSRTLENEQSFGRVFDSFLSGFDFAESTHHTFNNIRAIRLGDPLYNPSRDPAVPDTISPSIFDVQCEATKEGVEFRWQTDEVATSTVYYGVDTPYENVLHGILEERFPDAGHSNYTKRHGYDPFRRLVITDGLLPHTTYQFVVVSEDPAGNTAESYIYTFYTPQRLEFLTDCWDAQTATWGQKEPSNYTRTDKSIRVVLKKDKIYRTGNKLRVLFRGGTSGTLTVHTPSIAKSASSNHSQVAGGSWQRLYFNGADTINIPAGESAWSDWIDCPIENDADYVITFYMGDQAGVNDITAYWGTECSSLSARSYSYTGDISLIEDWSEYYDSLEKVGRIYAVEKVEICKAFFTQVLPGESIQEAINTANPGDLICVSPGIYSEEGESITVDVDDITIAGEETYGTIINSNIIFENSNSSISGVTVYYKESSYRSFIDSDVNLLCNAGITAVNSDITVKNCIIMPDLDAINYEGDYDSPLDHYGKGIQIWNFYGNEDIEPLIENNLILNADTGIYLFSQAFGGAILGELKQNTLDANNYGIVLRMHKENPWIHNSIITRSTDAIHLTYDSLLTERLGVIENNCFGAGEYTNTHNVWCDELQAEQLTLPDAAGNIAEDPEYTDPENLDYTPLNENCEDKGYRPE